jgi:hypothetical protein
VSIDIPTAAYEQLRSAFELSAWVDETFRRLKSGDDFERQYFERIGENVKPFIEEMIPVSRLGLYLSTPGKEVFVQCFTDNRAYDAEIQLGVDDRAGLRIEVTTTDEPPQSAMRRQALSRNGNVSLTGTMWRDGRTVSDEPVMIEVAEEEQRQIELALSRLQRKVDSGRYDSDTAILVYLTDCWVWPLYALRADLMRRTDQYLQTVQPPIHSVYFCYMQNL